MAPLPRTRIEAVKDLLAENRPVVVQRSRWPSGEVSVSAYLGAVDLPLSVTRGVRCLVTVGDQLVLCENLHGAVHAWPGGGREGDETLVETARREVHEETGWIIDPDSFRRLGWLHIENLSAVPADHPYPYPDCLYLVGTGESERREPGSDGDWVDPEGSELRSWLVPLSEARHHIRGDPHSLAFVDVVARQKVVKMGRRR